MKISKFMLNMFIDYHKRLKKTITKTKYTHNFAENEQKLTKVIPILPNVPAGMRGWI